MDSPHGFAGLGLSTAALESLDRAGYEHPTPVQQRAIPPALQGLDVVGCAATGTGKTAAFVLPVVERLQGRRGTRALVLAPTRELALQIAQHVEMFGRGRGVRGAVVMGGVGMEPQVRALRDGHEVVVATPGRLVDHLDRGTARLDGIEILVLDEADRMLDMGFRPQLERVLARLPSKRQTMLFSATMAGEVAEFARRHLHSPVRVEVARSGTVAEKAQQRVFHLAQVEKAALLLALLAEDEASTLVFTRTKRRADNLCRILSRAGHDAERIHANRSQNQRRHALESFRTGFHRILVATDIASRGLDVEDIGHVVNFDLPHVPEDYVHRVGRTARASASGRASAFCSPEERPLLADIEKLTRAPVPVAEVPRESPVFQEEAKRREKLPMPVRRPDPRPALRAAARAGGPRSHAEPPRAAPRGKGGTHRAHAAGGRPQQSPGKASKPRPQGRPSTHPPASGGRSAVRLGSWGGRRRR